MTLMARHPDTVRSAVLDSLNPPDTILAAPWSARMAEAREAFFAACAADPACSAAYPDLADTYRETVRRLGDSASSVALPPALHVPGDDVRLTPSLFACWRASSIPNIGPALSRHVAELIGRRARWLLFAGLGHNVRHFSPCATDIVAAFIAEPTGELDTACADRAPTIVFQPRR